MAELVRASSTTKRHSWWFGCAAFAVCAAVLTAHQSIGDDGLQAVNRAARNSDSAFRYVRELTDGIGPRLTGTPADKQAGDWALRTMREVGLQQVHAETWDLEKAWTRDYARARMIHPFPLELSVTSYGWAAST